LARRCIPVSFDGLKILRHVREKHAFSLIKHGIARWNDALERRYLVPSEECALRPNGELRGWQVKESGGFLMWQFVKGGEFQPLTR
jgi:hypothetical protein